MTNTTWYYNPTPARVILPTTLERLADRIYTRALRFRARVRNLVRLTKASKLRVRIVVIAFVIYNLSPLELIPDIIPGLGQLDELVLLFLVVWYVKRHDPAVAKALMSIFK